MRGDLILETDPRHKKGVDLFVGVNVFLIGKESLMN